MSFLFTRALRLRQDLPQHCEVVAAIDELEALVVFPVVELVGGGDVEGGEEGGLVEEAGECEGGLPGVWWTEVYGEGENAVASVISTISGVPV